MISPENNVTFILGPTNTGKTFMAIERMVSYDNGIIGLPLRLLAREVYDKIVIKKGKLNTALITGEEQIIPPRARYFICTVEAMPTDKLVDFIAVDEIQLCNDYERGHIFTEKLLYARGNIESLFLGSDNIEPIIKKLFPHSKICVQFVPTSPLIKISTLEDCIRAVSGKYDSAITVFMDSFYQWKNGGAQTY